MAEKELYKMALYCHMGEQVEIHGWKRACSLQKGIRGNQRSWGSSAAWAWSRGCTHQLRLQPVVGGGRRRKGKVLVTLLQETVPH